MPDIVTIGEALVEIMRKEPDRPLDSPADFAGPYPSGAPAISASAAARLGAKVAFVGAVGEDPFGRCIVNRLRADGIDCRALAQRQERITGIAFVSYRSDGSRSFLFHLADSAAATIDLAQIPDDVLDTAGIVHVMGSSLSVNAAVRETCYAVVERVKASGGRVSLDPNLRPELMPADRIRAVCEPVLRHCDLVLPSGEELMTLTGADRPAAGAQQLLDAGVEIVALKQGAAGSTLYTRDRSLPVAPFAVEEVDPTGAGDCYDAALLVGLTSGWSLERAGAFANAVGALATTRLGPMEGTFSLAEVAEFMRAQGRPLEEMGA